MKIIIETIPHEEQRYPTVGDWFYDADGTLRIKVSDLQDSRYEFLIALHELVEVEACRHAGVSQAQVDDFDKDFEERRSHGDYIPCDEPGDAPNAPYSLQHCLATGIERIMAAHLEIDWSVYEAKIGALP